MFLDLIIACRRFKIQRSCDHLSLLILFRSCLSFCVQAIVASLEEAEEMQQHVENLDEALKLNLLKRAAVPGKGDCQYLALVESAKKQGIHLGGAAELRIKTLQGLLNHKERYMEWCMRGPTKSK